jgi:hypothetical protein
VVTPLGPELESRRGVGGRPGGRADAGWTKSPFPPEEEENAADNGGALETAAAAAAATGVGLDAAVDAIADV